MQVEKIDWVVDKLQEARRRGDVMQRSRQSDASWPMIQMAARADPRVVAGLEFCRAADAGDPGVTPSWHSRVTTRQVSGKVAASGGLRADFSSISVMPLAGYAQSATIPPCCS
jgi:hypothetical protein